MKTRTGNVMRGWALGAAFLATTPVVAQTQVVLKNDSLPDDIVGTQQTYGLQVYFNAGEEVNVWLTTPCDGNIVAIQILWTDFNGTYGQSVESALGLYEAGSFPDRGFLPLQQAPFGDVVLVGPRLTSASGALNEFRFLDENNQIPMAVPVTAGQTFVVSLEIGWDDYADLCNSSPPPCGQPTVAIDLDGCTPNRNGINNPGIDSCGAGVVGDFIIRAIVECSSGDGACCMPDGSCVVQDQATCESNLGVYQGVGTTCGEVTCTPPTGACCTSGACVNVTLDECTNIYSGTWLGPSQDCNVGDPCGFTTTGVCCLPDKTCIETTQPDCLAQSGTYHGSFSSCDLYECDPTGACCFDNGDGTYTCFPALLTETDCGAAGGSWKGAGSDCSLQEICIPTGACCFDTGFCIEGLTEANCLQIATNTWLGADSTCAGGCPAACPADCADGDGQVAVNDLLALLGNWGSPGACDIDPATPNGMIDVNDLLDLLAAWGPCP